MSYTEFCCRSGGSNLNAGTRTGDSTVPGTSADLTYAAGSWVAATGVFTVASGAPDSDGVAVGDFASVFASGATVTGFVGRITARTSTTITVSLTAKAGTAPVDGTGNRELRIGGAWKGPNAAEDFPFGFLVSTLTNAGGDQPRANFRNDANFSITAAVAHAQIGAAFHGFTTTYGDGGIAQIVGPTTGASFVMLTVSGAGNELCDLELYNNGATSTSGGVVVSSNNVLRRVVVHDVRGIGFSNTTTAALFVECEAYACNTSNTASTGGFSVIGKCVRCVSHNNSGSNNIGFLSSANGAAYFENCIADSNGSHGFASVQRAQTVTLKGCDAYANGGDGLRCDVNTTAGGITYAENCNFIGNGGYGVRDVETTLAHRTVLVNCGFGAGTEANSSGAVATNAFTQEIGSVTYPNDVTPWVDPDNGDFRITLAAAKGAGRGAFVQTQSGYAGAVGYPDIGAAQHQESAGAALLVLQRRGSTLNKM